MPCWFTTDDADRWIHTIFGDRKLRYRTTGLKKADDSLLQWFHLWTVHNTATVSSYAHITSPPCFPTGHHVLVRQDCTSSEMNSFTWSTSPSTGTQAWNFLCHQQALLEKQLVHMHALGLLQWTLPSQSCCVINYPIITTLLYLGLGVDNSNVTCSLLTKWQEY